MDLMPLRSLLLFVLPLAGSSAADDAGRPAAVAPKLVSLKFEGVTAARALAELTQQTGIVVEDRLGATGEEFALDLSGTTFWPALDAIARAAHARVELYGRDCRLALVRRPAGYSEPPISYSAPFRTALKRITESRDMETGGNACTASLEVAWEPTLEPLYLDTSPQALVVRDDKGRELPARSEGSLMAPVDGRLAKEFDVPLPGVPRSVKSLGTLEGKLGVIAPSKMLTFTFDTLDRLADVSADSPLRRRSEDGVTCRIARVQLVSDRWTVQVMLDYPPDGVRLESHQSRVVANELVLESKDGSKRVPAGGYVVDSAGDRRAVINYHFFDADKALGGKPAEWKVRYRAPASLVEVSLSFALKDVPLP
jgi:hypothetical protein